MNTPTYEEAQKPKEIKTLMRNVTTDELILAIKTSPDGKVLARNHWGNSQMTWGAILTYFIKDGKLCYKSWSKTEKVHNGSRQLYDICKAIY